MLDSHHLHQFPSKFKDLEGFFSRPNKRANNLRNAGEIWYSKPLIEDSRLSDEEEKIVANYFGADNLPSDHATYYKDVEGQLMLFFSPATETLAMAVRATPCDKPESRGMTKRDGR